MAQVVPDLQSSQTAEEADAAIVDFRDSALRSPVWRTSAGEGLLKWFWKTRLGRWVVNRFKDAEPDELHGYAFWGPVALLVLVTELIGTGWFGKLARWPTISSTVGHLQDLNSFWGVPVVGLIAIAAFYAMAYRIGPPRETGGDFYLIRRGRVTLRYGWPIVFGATALITIQARFSDKDKYELGYALYGSLAFFGIIVPLVLVWLRSEHAVFPSLFYTFKSLSTRFRWVAALVAAGLAILVIHLALYPWPDLAREPARFAGLNGPAARARAEQALNDQADAKPNLVYSTRARSVHRGQDAWFVYFNEVTNGSQTHVGCYVIVVRDAAPTVVDECLG